MPTELQGREEPNTTAASSNLSPKKMNTVSNQASKAMQKKILKNKNEMSNKPKPASKKSSCICAPTTHVGSFRCRLHRTGVVSQKSSQKLLEGNNNSKSITQSFISTNTNTQQQQQQQHSHQLSRFGIAALTQ